jgi:predicted outer membrane repeat protein
MSIVNSNPTLNNCMFVGNITDQGGGAIKNEKMATIIGCKFINNSAGSLGGAISNGSETENCVEILS